MALRPFRDTSEPRELLVITNNIPRPILCGYELTEKESADFDYMDDINEGSFFRYKGQVYDLAEFVRIDKSDSELSTCDGIHTDSFFSAVLVKLSDCGEAVTVGLALS